MKRLLIAGILVVAALGARSGPATAAASLPPLVHSPGIHSGDYVFEAGSCTTPTAAGAYTCAEEITLSPYPGVGAPTSGAVLACGNYTRAGLQTVGVVYWGAFTSPFATGNNGGAMGMVQIQPIVPGPTPGSLPMTAWVYNNISAFSTVNYATGTPALTSGSAAGSLTVNNSTDQIMSGTINIAISGSLTNKPYRPGATTTQGAITCQITSGSRSFAIADPYGTDFFL